MFLYVAYNCIWLVWASIVLYHLGSLLQWPLYIFRTICPLKIIYKPETFRTSLYWTQETISEQFRTQFPSSMWIFQRKWRYLVQVHYILCIEYASEKLIQMKLWYSHCKTINRMIKEDAIFHTMSGMLSFFRQFFGWFWCFGVLLHHFTLKLVYTMTHRCKQHQKFGRI